MKQWNLHDKDGKYRSRRAFKQDCRLDSEEPWENKEYRNKQSNKTMSELNLFKKKKKSNNILDFGR